MSDAALAITVRTLEAADLDAYKALRDHALLHHAEAFTSDAAAEAQRTAASYAARLGGQDDASCAAAPCRAPSASQQRSTTSTTCC